MTARTRAAPPALDRFRFDALVGSGAFGDVYRAVDLRHGGEVAVKVMRRSSAQEVRQLKREFRALSGLAHRSLVTLYELVVTGDACCLAMEFVHGVDLLRALRAGRPGSPSHARLRAVLAQVVDALATLHAAGKLHRDMKPSNVLVTAEDRAVVLDFGFARELAPSGSWSLDDGLGTVAYMSPEQAYGLPLTEASDWYSFGVTLYEVLTGALPFTGNAMSVLYQKNAGDAPDPAALAPGAPDDLLALCRRLLAREPSARPRAHEVLATFAVAMPPTVRLDDASDPVSLLDREDAMHALGTAARRALDRRTQVVSIAGPSGIGKTALVEHHLDALLRTGAFYVLRGRCWEFESVPYKALDGVVDTVVRRVKRNDDPSLDASLERAVPSLSMLFTAFEALHDRVSAGAVSAPPGDPRELRRRAAADLRALLHALATPRVPVLALDDVQWADADSAELLTELLRAPSVEALLVIVTHRDDGSASPCVRAALDPSLPAEPTRITLGPLGERASEQLAARFAGDHDGLAARIARGARGNPFFVRELARHAVTSREEAPDDLDALVRARVARLPVAPRRLVQVVSLAGAAVPTAVALRAAGIAEGNAALRALRDAWLVRTSGDEASTLVPFHDRVREAVAASVEPTMARELHTALADAWEREGDADHEVLLRHRQAAGDTRRAAVHAAQAAARARAALAFDHAVTLYRTALSLGEARGEARAELLEGLGHALIGVGRGRDAADALRAAAEGASPTRSLARRRLAVEHLLCAGYLDEGMAVARGVLADVGVELPPRGPAAVVALLAQRARLRLRGTSFRPRTAAACDPDTLARIDACWALATGLGMFDVARAAALQARGLRLALDAGDTYRVARALAMEGAFYAADGLAGADRARALLDAARALARELDHPHAVALTAVMTGTTAWLEGRWRDAAVTLEGALDALATRCAGAVWERNTATVFLFDAWVYLGEFGALLDRAPRMRADAEARGDRYALTVSHLRFECVAAMVTDTPERADEGLSRVGLWSAAGFFSMHLIEMHERAEVAMYRGEGRAAWQGLVARWPDLERSMLLRVQAFQIQMRFVRGRAALAAARDGAPDGAALRAVAADDAARMLDERTPWGDALAAVLQAAILAQTGAFEAAARGFERAVTLLERTEMTLHAAAARRAWGALVGGASGRALVDAADASMRAQRVVAPERFAQMLCPARPL